MKELRGELTQYRMKRADETLVEARILADAERWNASVNRLYYACFCTMPASMLSLLSWPVKDCPPANTLESAVSSIIMQKECGSVFIC